jgi:AcrR family transcriptional regulator
LEVLGIEKRLGECSVAIGRPRTFDTDQALDRALEVFWRKGFEGASICDLTSAMGINPPSLYAAFGNKEALFRRALDRYAETKGEFVREALDKPKARDAVAALLHGTVRHLTDKSNPAGCLLVQGIAGAGEHAQCIRDELSARRAASEKAICERLKRGQAEGDLPADADPASLARFISTVTQGMAIQAASGASRKSLERVVETALQAWPG